MSTAVKLSPLKVEIPADIQARFRQQIAQAEADEPESNVAKLRRRFREFLEANSSEDRLDEIMGYYQAKFKAENLNFDRHLTELMQDKKLSYRAKYYVGLVLIKQKRLFELADESLFQIPNSNILLPQFLEAMDEAELISNLKNLRISTNLDQFARALVTKFETAERVQEILGTAYGANVEHEREIEQAFEDFFAGREVAMPPVKRNLQALLVEVLKITQDASFSDLCESYIDCADPQDRRRFAELIIQSYEKQALEFFQDQAMHALEANPSPKDIALKLDAIDRYCSFKTDNQAETLMNIMLETREPKVVIHVLKALSQAKELKVDKLVLAVKTQAQSEKASPILYTLMRLVRKELSNILPGKFIENLFAKILKTVPDLSDVIAKLEVDFDLKDSDAAGFEKLNDITQEHNKENPLMYWLLNKIPVFRLLEHLFSQSKRAQENALGLLAKLPNEVMVSFHRHAQRFNSERDLSLAEALKSAVGLGA